MEGPCWSQPSGMVNNGSWHHKLLGHEDNHYNWTDCEAGHSNKVPVTLLIALCGLAGNGAVLWLLGSRVRRNPITVYVLSLAAADFTFLLSIAIALVIFYGPESLCHSLGSQDVTTVLNITILSTFTASIYLLTAFSATTALSILPPSCCPCHRSWHLPALVCALLWVLSFLLTLTLYFCPAALAVFILSYLLSVLTLIFSGLTLLARILCCSWQYPPRKLSAVVLLPVFFFPFFTADFGYWLLLRLFDFSVFVFDASLPLACLNSSIKPVIYFLAGSCAKKFTLSVRVAFQRAFEDVSEPQNRGGTPRETSSCLNLCSPSLREDALGMEASHEPGQDKDNGFGVGLAAAERN
ncbi:PREDICTED: mas-related G-protein coupled receptor member X1-like [Pterocles gutturalis]|uniref:mas-related G-protein coupled receptor member X1-like n=1 Tax=Pterocles gutturalis TaxID=240206 RepID=UPI000528DFD2|nr:PREDICTED: mas-related G-protein coupled receptor member X1-like [Pterocles gutturalis]